jgi:hypothetical protein
MQIAPNRQSFYHLLLSIMLVKLINWCLFLGLLLRGFTDRGHEGLRGVLPSDQRDNVLVPQGVLRARGGGRRLDRKYMNYSDKLHF